MNGYFGTRRAEQLRYYIWDQWVVDVGYFPVGFNSVLSTIKASIIGLNCEAEDGRLFKILGNANCNTNTLRVAKVHILLNKLQ